MTEGNYLAWRESMPTFTDASLIAAGSGILLWSRLVGATSAAVVTALFAAGTWSFHVMIAPPPGP